MKIFQHPNMNNFRCPICGTSDDKPVGLVIIDGTEKKGIIEAIQVHIECLNLVYFDDGKKFLIGQVCEKGEE